MLAVEVLAKEGGGCSTPTPSPHHPKTRLTVLPRRLSSWFWIMTSIGILFALVSFNSFFMLLPALIGLGIAPIFLRMLGRKIFDYAFGSKHRAGPLISVLFATMVYALIIPGLITVYSWFEPVRIIPYEVPGYMLTTALLGASSGFIASSTITDKERIRTTFWLNPRTFQALVLNPIVIACSILAAITYDSAACLIPVFPAISISGVFLSSTWEETLDKQTSAH